MEAQNSAPEASWEITRCKPTVLQERKHSPRDVARPALKNQHEPALAGKSRQVCEAQGMTDGQVHAPALPLEKKNIAYKASRPRKSVNVKAVCGMETTVALE